MFKTIPIIILSAVLLQCNRVHEVLIAENHYDLGVIKRLKLYSDSVFTFSMNRAFENDSVMHCSGRFSIKHDTIIFSKPFYRGHGSTAIIKKGFLEFLDSTEPLKLQIIQQNIVKKSKVDTLGVKDVSVFTYMPAFYHNVFPIATQYDLSDEEIVKVDSLVKLCILENKDLLTLHFESFNRQYVAVINQHGEKEVWINCECKYKYPSNGYKYHLIYVADGGDCYFQLLVNLDKQEYHSLTVNGEA
jgi:hypothetical protein